MSGDGPRGAPVTSFPSAAAANTRQVHMYSCAQLVYVTKGESIKESIETKCSIATVLRTEEEVVKPRKIGIREQLKAINHQRLITTGEATNTIMQNSTVAIV